MERRNLRLAILQELCPQALKTDEIMKRLRQSNVVSGNYSKRCIETDIWFIRHQEDIDISRFGPNGCICGYSGVWFHVIKEALMDYHSGRPCDVGIWRGDLPPRRSACQPRHHICATQAKEFLMQVANSDYEVFAGLSPGTIVELLDRIDSERNPGNPG